LATNSTQSASSSGGTSSQAKKRLEDALTRLESALDKKEKEMAGAEELKESLASANQEISDLKNKNATIATRLDGAIDRMKAVLGES